MIISALRNHRRATGGVDKADVSRRESDWVSASKGYRAYLKRNSRDFGVQMRLIKTLYASGRLDEAEILLSETRLQRPEKRELAEMAAIILRARTASVSIDKYDLFRRNLVIPRPPVAPPSQDGVGNGATVVVDARDKSSILIELTLESLGRSEIPVGPVVLLSEDQEASDLFFRQAALSRGPVLMVDAGATLDPCALGWLIHALETTRAGAAYCDDDYAAEEEGTIIWFAPAFYVAPHPLDLATTPRVPAAVLFRPEILSGSDSCKDRHTMLMDAFDAGPVAHVPLLLTTRQSSTQSGPVKPISARPVTAGRILTIIPTRDEGAALKIMIESIETKAAQPSQLEIVVVDNGSRDPDTLLLLAALVRAGRIRVLSVDEPFNWSRLNNLAAAGADADILLFANNDMQMITESWDDLLRQSLLQPGVGVVGARLVYPNGLLQHGGIALGAFDGRPVHEGLGETQEESGPLDRWRRRRPAAAVTGAFMGVRREVFEQVGGFNAMEFAVGCNDIDFCLRVRERGWSVLYDADVELIHCESRSRGHDDTEDRMRRARGELEALFRIWGDDAGRDPGRNPHWVNHESLLYQGLRQPDANQVEAWLRRSTDLWRVRTHTC